MRSYSLTEMGKSFSDGLSNKAKDITTYTVGDFIGKINRPDTDYKFFGDKIAITDDHILASAYNETTDVGQVYLFDKDGGYLHTFSSPSANDSKYYGSGISMSENKVIIGDPGDDTGGTDRGYVYVYDLSDYSLITSFQSTTPTNNDDFGYTIKLYKNRLLITAIGTAVVNTINDGSVYIYDKDNVFIREIVPTPSSGNADTNFGFAIDVTEDLILVGAPSEDVSGTDTDDGAAYLFDIYGNLIQKMTAPTPTIDNHFGGAVNITDRYVLVGTPWKTNTSAKNGSVFVYDLSGTYIKEIECPLTTQDQQFGSSITSNGDYIVIGGPGSSTNEGKIYIYDKKLTYLKTLKFTDDFDNGALRYGIYITSNSTRVITCSPSTVDTVDDGHVYIYALDGVNSAEQIDNAHDNMGYGLTSKGSSKYDNEWSPVQTNPNTLTKDYTLQTGVSGSAVSGFTVADGVTLTIPDGSTLSIV